MSTRPWTPDDLDAAPAIWFVGDDPRNVISRALVSAIHNRGTLAQPLVPALPGMANGEDAFELGAINGRTCLRATDEHPALFAALGSAEAMSGATGATTLCVQRQRTRGAAGSYRAILSVGRVASASARYVLWRDAYVAGLSTTCGFGTAGNTNANVSETSTDPEIVAGIADWSDSSTTTRRNGAQAARTAGSGSTGANETDAAYATIQIGGRIAGQVAAVYPNPSQDLGELLFFSRVLTHDELAKVEGYLAWQWGLQASLPASHTYSSAAPTVEVPDPQCRAGYLPTSADSCATRAARARHGTKSRRASTTTNSCSSAYWRQTRTSRTSSCFRVARSSPCPCSM